MLKNTAGHFSILFFIYLTAFGLPQVYAAEIERVSVSSTGKQTNDNSNNPSLSADGRFVAFDSLASNLVPNDTNNSIDVFIFDRNTNVTERVSVSTSNVQANRESISPSLSANGRFVAFASSASNLVLGDTNSSSDIFVHDRNTGVTERVSVSTTDRQANGKSFQPSLSADGRFVAFFSYASNLIPGGTNNDADIFVHDRNTGVTEHISVSSTGVQGNGFSSNPSLSADGRFVAFSSDASNLLLDDTNKERDIFIYDRDTSLIKRVNVSSTGRQGDGEAAGPSISADGRFVAFHSYASNHVPGDTNDMGDIFVHNQETGTTKRISLSSDGLQANNHSLKPSLSSDGRFVAFFSSANNLVPGDTNNNLDTFMHDRVAGVTELVTVTSTGGQANSGSAGLSISVNGQFVAFHSDASNLVPGDTNQAIDVFIAKTSLDKFNDDFVVTLRHTSGSTPVGEYIRFRARLTNHSDTTLANCKALLVNPLINYQREFSYYSYPLNVSNPIINGSIDIAPGESGQFNLAILPRVAMRREVRFDYVCDDTSAFAIPFINTIHLTAKTEPLIAEDFVRLENSNNRTELKIDRNSGKYWTGYVVNVSNTGSELTSINLTTMSFLPDAILRRSQLCEPFDPDNNNWTCINPRDIQLQVDLEPGERKKILVYVHARQPIDEKSVANRVYLEARDSAGEVVAKTSLGVSTIN